MNKKLSFFAITIFFCCLPAEAKLKSQNHLEKIERAGAVQQNSGNYKEALNSYGQACSQGLGSACVRQAAMEEKIGSLDKAKELLFTECEFKNKESCHDLGRLLLKRNESLGKMFLVKACSPPSFAICEGLSKSTPEALMKYVQSFEVDWETASGKTRGDELLTEACKLGHLVSCEVLNEKKK